MEFCLVAHVSQPVSLPVEPAQPTLGIVPPPWGDAPVPARCPTVIRCEMAKEPATARHRLRKPVFGRRELLWRAAAIYLWP